jgi:hypothetical protein
LVVMNLASCRSSGYDFVNQSRSVFNGRMQINKLPTSYFKN